MSTLLNNWHFMRLLRAGIAIWATVEAFRTTQWLLLLPAGIFAVQAIFDIGCCGTAGCVAPQQKQYSKSSGSAAEEVAYEEVK
ncbi:MAG: hypothetical protein ACKVU0_15020 [Saprospiraceae bacterium]